MFSPGLNITLPNFLLLRNLVVKFLRYRYFQCKCCLLLSVTDGVWIDLFIDGAKIKQQQLFFKFSSINILFFFDGILPRSGKLILWVLTQFCGTTKHSSTTDSNSVNFSLNFESASCVSIIFLRY